MSSEKLQAQLAALGKAKYIECFLEGAELIMEESKNTVHVDTGFLRDSHSVEVTDTSVNIIVSAPYAGIEEYGDAHRDGHPYLRPALDKMGEKALELTAQAVEKKIREVI